MLTSAFSMLAMNSVCHLVLCPRALTERTKIDGVFLIRD